MNGPGTCISFCKLHSMPIFGSQTRARYTPTGADQQKASPSPIKNQFQQGSCVVLPPIFFIKLDCSLPCHHSSLYTAPSLSNLFPVLCLNELQVIRGIKETPALHCSQALHGSLLADPRPMKGVGASQQKKK